MFDADAVGNTVGQQLARVLEEALATYPPSRETAHAALAAAIVVSGHVLSWATQDMEAEARLDVLEEFYANVERTTHAILQVRQQAEQERHDD